MLALSQTSRRRIRQLAAPFSEKRLATFSSLQCLSFLQNTAPYCSSFFPKSLNRRSVPHRYWKHETIRQLSSSALENQSGESSTSLTVEEQYTRKTPLEHVLLRPGMYVGPCERLPPQPCWVLEPTPPPPSNGTTSNASASETSFTSEYRMVQQELGLVPALIKVFDEILVNASDNKLRDTNCSRLDVMIDPGSDAERRQPTIRIYNDGRGVPVQIHKGEKMYVPEMVFGHLLTGSNFDDSEKRLTGGRHGYGAKLTNIFSKAFTVETIDSSTQQRYRQTWYNNMKEPSEPEIAAVAPSEKDYTCITFIPDIPRLTGNPNQMSISDEDYAIMCRRVIDTAGCHSDLQVALNGEDVSMGSFEAYSQLYRSSDAQPLCFQSINSWWHVGIGLSENGSFESVSFVNGMSTHRGGTHVNVIVNQVAKRIQEEIEKQCDPDLAMAVTSALIRRNLFVAVNSKIVNPNFDSQMKEYLTSSPDNFGSSYSLSKKFLNTMLVQPVEKGGPGIVEEIIRLAKGRQQAMLLKEVGGKKSKRQLLSIPKLEDAHKAASGASSDCTLILTEGDSAKALAVAGLEVLGRDLYGVFPLRGKFLNVRVANLAQLTNNAEVKALVAILGLDFDKEYETMAERSELRYGHVMLMTDQDTDGSHIKGLVINFFRHFWPKLLMRALDEPPELDKNEGSFLSSFVTPLLKAMPRNRGKTKSLSFYSLAEYNEWKSTFLDPQELAKNWSMKYYKGLGTSTPAEAKEYFSAFDNHFRPFHWDSDLDGELLDMVFDKSGAAARRDWILGTYDPDSTIEVDPETGNSVTYQDFVNKEMIHFSNADNIRSLPSVIDGLKPSQRKVLYACFKRKLKNEIKVAQLTGYCAEHTAYHHGEASLQATIIGLAQDFVGSNNINLLVPSGQFGTRLTGGKDAASPRYIFTQLSPISRHLFPEEDDILLKQLEDDGQMIEPEYYCPILPLLLINGSQGIGTGWSTMIPPFDPEDILEYIRAKLDRLAELPPIRPYAKGFTGKIEHDLNGGGFVTYGRAKQATPKSVIIDELPLKCWTEEYKQRLLKMRDRGEISSFVENHTTAKVSFEVHMKSVKLTRVVKAAGGLETAFKLKSTLPTTNMNAFDAEGTIRKFNSAEEIVDAYFPIRLNLYHDRKSVLESEMKYSFMLMQNKANFIRSMVAGEIDLVSGRHSKDEILERMKQLGFASTTDLVKIKNDNSVFERTTRGNQKDDIAENPTSGTQPTSEFDYLLNMPLSSLTAEKIDQLQADAARTGEELEKIKEKSPADLWRADLNKIAPHIKKMKATA